MSTKPEYEWQPDPVWWVVSPDTAALCRFGSHARGWCRAKAIAAMRRGKVGHWQYWNYCGEHMYGRKIINGVVMVQCRVEHEEN